MERSLALENVALSKLAKTLALVSGSTTEDVLP
jgi:hypothetical protein